jgi:hypothetical protein
MKLPKLDFHNRKTQLAAGAVAAVTAFALYRRHVANATGAAGATSGTTVAGNGSLTDPLASAAFGQAATESNIVSDIQPQLDQLAKLISGLQTAPTQPTPAPPAPKPAPNPVTTKKTILPVLHAGDFLPSVLGSSKDLLSIGSVGAGEVFSGHNVAAGAPVYYLTPGSTTAKQGIGAKAPAGTKVFTLASLKQYVAPATTKYTLK